MRARPYLGPARPGRSRSARKAFPVAWEDRTSRCKFCCNAGELVGENRIARDELIRRINGRRRLVIRHVTRASKGVNTVWTKKLATKSGHALHQRKLELAYRFREGLRRRDWYAAIAATQEYRRVRTSLCPAYMTGVGAILHSARRQGGTAFLLGAGVGGAVLVLNPDDRASRMLRDHLSKLYGELSVKVQSCGCEYENIQREEKT